MIYQATIMYMSSMRALKPAQHALKPNGDLVYPYVIIDAGEFVDTWAALKRTLEETGDTVVFANAHSVDTPFRAAIQLYDLQKYIVLDTPFLKNPNYPGSPPKIGFVVMKGIKK